MWFTRPPHRTSRTRRSRARSTCSRQISGRRTPTSAPSRPRSHRWLRLLAKGKHLRGTVLDPFGHTALRRTERALIEHYRDMVVGAADALDADGYDTATAAASASELVRGYESVKVGNIDRYCRRLEELGFAAPELAV